MKYVICIVAYRTVADIHLQINICYCKHQHLKAKEYKTFLSVYFNSNYVQAYYEHNL